ncbi:hypothetical protein ACJ72_07691 [Emergomyces africanus]|uniref:Uncharacterized protein n=1 Tax=Emergomyces africanus TaxID=1955775 RepID=A0A1B7NMH5_9EURO|nr:hypothetical protein ACJ72_07691 [Emergomyces africanus]
MYKIDGFQSNQALMIIVDLVIDKKIDFLNKLNHINITLSCALHGWYVITNFITFETEQYKQVNQFYMKMISHFKQACMFYKIKEMSQCEYLDKQYITVIVADSRNIYRISSDIDSGNTDDNNTDTDVVVDAATTTASVSEMNNNNDADNVSSAAALIHSINNNTEVVLDNTINSFNAASDVIGNSIIIITIIIIISDAASATQAISQ